MMLVFKGHPSFTVIFDLTPVWSLKAKSNMLLESLMNKSVSYTSVPLCSLTFGKLHNKSTRCKYNSLFFVNSCQFICMHTYQNSYGEDALSTTLKMCSVKVISICIFLQQIGPQSVQTLRNLIGKLTTNQRSILRFIACNEIFMMPAIVFMIFT